MAKKTPAPRLVPEDVREVTDVALDDADNFCRNWLEGERQALTLVEKQFDDARAGVDAIADKALAFARMNLTSAFEFAHRLMQARDIADFARLQVEFYQSQSQAFLNQVQELGTAFAKLQGAGFALPERKAR